MRESQPSEQKLITVPSLSEAEFIRFARFVTDKLGIRMPRVKLLMLQSRLLRRLRDLNIHSFEHYQHRLFDSPHAEEEQHAFFDLITTNKTEFYREQDHFDFLSRNILPRWKDGLFSVWSAGCSSGEEPYTLAMILADHELSHPGFDFRITATDISQRILHTAREAIYDEIRISPVPLQQRHRHLLRGKGDKEKLVRVAPELRARVRFASLNLMDEHYPVDTGLAVIFFRNVMIYFDRETQLRVLERMCGHLRPGGHLFISHTESILGGRLPLLPVAPSVFRRQA